MNTKTKNMAVPELRFPEFQGKGEWEIEPLGKLIDGVSKRNRDKKISRVFTNSAVSGIIDQRDFFDKDIATKGNTDNYCVVEFGDYVYNPRISEHAPVGPTSKNKLGEGIVSPLYTVFRFRNPENSFYEYYFKSASWQKSLKAIGNSGARHDRMGISLTQLQLVEVASPLPAEQQKIAECLSSLDDLIAARSAKLEALKAHKRGLMQALFPAEGETVPKLRFPEFQSAGAWEEQALGELCKFIRGPFGGALKKEIFVPKGYAVYEQSHAIYNDFKSFRYHITKDKFDELKRFAVHPGDIIMSCSGTMGKFATIPVGSEEGVINQALLKLTVKEGYNVHFIKLSLELPINQEKLLSQSAGGAIKNVVEVSQIKAITFTVPPIDEQQKIADCLSSLDHLLAAQAQHLEALKRHKKGLMQGLFPPTGHQQT